MCGLFLVGYGAFATQGVSIVTVGHRVVLRVPSEFTMVVPSPFVVAHPRRYLVTWVEPGGASHSKVIRTHGQPITVGPRDLDRPLLVVGFGAASLGFLGAFVEWGRAAKAWRRPGPQRPSTSNLVGPIASTT